MTEEAKTAEPKKYRIRHDYVGRYKTAGGPRVISFVKGRIVSGEEFEREIFEWAMRDSPDCFEEIHDEN